MNKFKNIKALTFDTGGTVLDWHNGFKRGFEKIKKDYNLKLLPFELANLMREISLKEITAQSSNKLINFDEAHRIAVEKILIEKNIKISDEDKSFIHHVVPTKLKAWPDFLDAFNQIKLNYPCISFTLLSNRLVYINSKANNISWDLVFSCETLEAYKPNLEAYIKVAKLLQIKTEECLMVACHSFDLNAAQKAGYKTAFVKRNKEWGEDTKINIDGDYDIVVDNFYDLHAELKN